MQTARITAAFALMAAASLYASGLASAATAHNSQAGAFGPSKNNCAATAYFPADSGCLGSYFEHYQDGDLPLPDGPRVRYRERPPLR